MQMKVCSKCKRELPKDVNHFHRWKYSKDGFRSACKECRGGHFGVVKINTVYKSKPGYKFCTKCRKELPMSSEYFSKLKCSNDGYNTVCKKCLGIEYGIHQSSPEKVKDGYKICNKCRRNLPATTDYYYEDKNLGSGLSSHCKECKGQVFGKTKFNPHVIDNSPDGYYTCRSCKNIYPLTTEYFTKDKRSKTGYHTYCKECYKIKSKNSQNKNIKHYRLTAILKSQRRRSQKQKLINNYTKEEWSECKNYFNNSCAYCGKVLKKLDQEHIIPLSKGGNYVKQNIVPSCKSCNSSKCNNDMEEWYRKQPFFSEERLAKIHKWMGVKNNIQQLKII